MRECQSFWAVGLRTASLDLHPNPRCCKNYPLRLMTAKRALASMRKLCAGVDFETLSVFVHFLVEQSLPGQGERHYEDTLVECTLNHNVFLHRDSCSALDSMQPNVSNASNHRKDSKQLLRAHDKLSFSGYKQANSWHLLERKLSPRVSLCHRPQTGILRYESLKVPPTGGKKTPLAQPRWPEAFFKPLPFQNERISASASLSVRPCC